MSLQPESGSGNWLKPERRWKGSEALVPVETCYRVLDLFCWAFTFIGGIAVMFVGFMKGGAIKENPLFWVALFCTLAQLPVAVFRGLPFLVRYGVFATGLLVFVLCTTLVLGITPNWAFLVIMLLVTTGLFFGLRAGLAASALLCALHVVVAWGWVRGYLPVSTTGYQGSLSYTDFRSAAVWARILIVTAGLLAALQYLLRYVLTDLNNALKDANRHLHKLAVEQEYRARAEEGRLKAELAVREAQKFDALGRMASGVAHDFNNALCVMKGWSSFLLDDTRDPLVRDAMGDIKRATDNAAQLTHHLLAFSRSDPARREVVNLGELVPLEAKTLRRLLPPDVTVAEEVCGPLHVRLGRGQLQEIILNLAINARDAMPRGGSLTLRVSEVERTETTAGRPAGRYARFEVSDTGTGMDYATRAHIFEPFFTTKAPGKGTGLGLAMVYGLVSGAGGWIDVQSALHEGTTFIIHLPVVVAEEIHQEPPAIAILHPTRCRVLVVDAQPEIRSLVERILVREGFPVIAVGNGDEALATLAGGEAGHFGLLVTEGIIPGASTMEIIQRALAGNPDCRVIIASAHLPDQLLLRGIETGRYGQLPKPFDTGQLREAVNEALGKKTATPAAKTVGAATDSPQGHEAHEGRRF